MQSLYSSPLRPPAALGRDEVGTIQPPQEKFTGQEVSWKVFVIIFQESLLQ